MINEARRLEQKKKKNSTTRIALIVTGGLGVEKKTVEAARKNKVNLISSPHDTATTAAFCRASIAVRHVLNEEFLALNEDASLEEIRGRATASGFAAFPVVDAQGRTTGILSKTDFLKPVERKLILVDHNELSQAVQGADQVEILEIIDHHRIGTLTTQQPILFRNEPVGSTSTIVADCFFRYGVELTSSIAGLLLAGIVSDTLNLTSPTTTVVDGEVLRRLGEDLRDERARFYGETFRVGIAADAQAGSQSDHHRLQGIQGGRCAIQRGANRRDRVRSVLETQS